MSCCKCKEHHWRDPQPTTYSDEAGQEYCLFHAPTEHKGMSVEDFNVQVFARIDAIKGRNTSEGKNENCYLSGTVFPGDISFWMYDENNPLPEISFYQATFGGSALFWETTFGSKADFSKATFSDVAEFVSTSFNNESNFSRATFIGRVEFGSATFCNAASFWKTTFNAPTDFSSATFHGEVDFGEATFEGEAGFGGATFSYETNFVEGRFNGEAYFGEAIFGGVSYFQGAMFGGKADFRKTKFAEETYFSEAWFSSEAQFRAIKANNKALRLHYLSSASLANLAFTSMETESFSFKGCDWPERLWPEAQNKPDYKACEELYRSLKQKAANEHDQPMVSKWHYREKLMALEQIQAAHGWPAQVSLTGVYYWCSGFGEDPSQAFRVLVILVVCALLALCGFKLWETGISGQVAWDKVLEIPVELLMLVPFTKSPTTNTLLGGLLGPTKALVTSLLHIVFAVQIALFAFALRNRFRR